MVAGIPIDQWGLGIPIAKQWQTTHSARCPGPTVASSRPAAVARTATPCVPDRVGTSIASVPALPRGAPLLFLVAAADVADDPVIVDQEVVQLAAGVGAEAVLRVDL